MPAFCGTGAIVEHQNAAFELYRILQEYLQRERVGHAYIAPADVTFPAAEILSPSTARADRITKRDLFRDEGVPE